MKLRYFSIFICVVLLAGCTRHAAPPIVWVPFPAAVEPDYIGHQGPKVVLIPLFDSSNSTLPWSVASEINQEIREKIKWDDTLLLYSDRLTFQETLCLGHETLEGAAAHVRARECGGDLLVLLELTQHDVLSLQREENPRMCCREGRRFSSTLAQRIRIKVIDLRSAVPRVVLEETLASHTTIPRAYEFFDYREHPLGSTKYATTPMALAHARIATDVANYIEEFARGL